MIPFGYQLHALGKPVSTERCLVCKNLLVWLYQFDSFQHNSTSTDLVHSHPKCINIARHLRRTSQQLLRRHPATTTQNAAYTEVHSATCDISLYTRESEVA